jgi:hypothetical protein
VQGAFKFSLFDPMCEEEAFQRVASRINELGALYNNATSFSEFSKIQGAAKDYVTRFLSLSSCARALSASLHGRSRSPRTL